MANGKAKSLMEFTEHRVGMCGSEEPSLFFS